MRILFVGDVVGTPGTALCRRALPNCRAAWGLDLIVVNAENATGGSGLNPTAYKQLRDAGADAITLGDHVYKKFEIAAVMGRGDPICKPANFPPEAPGREAAVVTAADGTPVAVFTVLGRTFMRPVDCPFRAADRVLAGLPAGIKCILLDVHAEATADKYLMAHHVAGRVSAVLGTHTHVPTADEQILPGGTAFVCDVGMTGPYESILGRRVDRVLSAALTFVPAAFDVATDDVRLGGAMVEIDAATGRATAIKRVMVREADLAELG